MPKVSIIIPVYNSELTLRRCVLSILNQSYRDYEIIAINDGSTDNSETILKEFSRTNDCFHFYSIENSGPSNARNFGLGKVTSEYVTFVDSDDYIGVDYLSKMIIAGFDLVACKTFLVYGNKKIPQTPIHHIDKNDYYSYIYTYFDMFSQCSKIFKTSIIKENSIYFRSDIIYGEDCVFVSEYIKHINSIYLLDYYGYYYVKSNNLSLSSRPTINVVNDLIVSRETVIKNINAINNPNDKKLFSSLIIKEICFGLSSFYSKVFYSNNLTKKDKIKLLKSYRNNLYYKILIDNRKQYSEGIMLRIYGINSINAQLLAFKFLNIIKKIVKGF